VLGFVARRLLAEPVALVVAARESGDGFSGLPELLVEGLRTGDARELLSSVAQGRLDERVQDRILAETGGNPLALLELPRALTVAELAGGFGVLDRRGLPGRIEESFLRRVESLGADAQQLLLVAAAEPAGEPVLMWRAARRLGIGAQAAAAAEAAGLVTIGEQVTFRHPLVRSAVYRAASRPPTTRLTRSVTPGILPRPPWSRMSGSRPSWNGRRAVPRHVEVAPRRPRSSSGQPS
jgi:hypothetical protein